MALAQLQTLSPEQRLLQAASKLCDLLEGRIERRQIGSMVSRTTQRPQNAAQTLKGLDHGSRKL